MLAMAERVMRSMVRRCEDGDTDALVCLLRLEELLPELIGAAIEALHESGYSWAEIAQHTGTTRQAVAKRAGAAKVEA